METDIKHILARLSALEERVSKIEDQEHVPTRMDLKPDPAKSKKISLGEFLVAKKPADDVKKTLAIGYYLEKLQGLQFFNIKDLEDAFVKAKEKAPANINDKVNMNIRNGHMAESPDKKDARKAWYLTNSGEQFVENNFNAHK